MRGNGRVGGHSVRALARPVHSCAFHATPAGDRSVGRTLWPLILKNVHNFPDSWKPTADDGLDHALHALHAHHRHAHRGRSSRDERTHLHANDECSHHDGAPYANERRPGT